MGKDNVVMKFSKYDDDHECQFFTTVAVMPSNLGTEPLDDDAEEGAANKKKKVPKEFVYVDDGSAVVKNWDKRQTDNSNEIKASRLKTTVHNVMNMVNAACPRYGPNDFTVATLGDEVSVYAHRDFPIGTLVLPPDTSETKSRRWTQRRAVMVKNATNLHPAGQHIVLDGRIRQDPRENHLLNLFFAVTRTLDEAAANCELVLTSTTQTMKVHIPNGPGKKRDFEFAFKEADLPQIPIITNTKKLAVGTKLVVLDDKALGKLEKKMKEDDVAKARKKLSDAAKNQSTQA